MTDLVEVGRFNNRLEADLFAFDSQRADEDASTVALEVAALQLHDHAEHPIGGN